MFVLKYNKTSYPDRRKTAKPKQEETQEIPGIRPRGGRHTIVQMIEARPNASYHQIDTGTYEDGVNCHVRLLKMRIYLRSRTERHTKYMP